MGAGDLLRRSRSVLRRWDLNAILRPDQICEAVSQLRVWPLRIVQVRALFPDA
ncbi:MAG: hypothetical protein AVDCRST_MAG10-2781 [uncultured Acidimicrobiales bacterium]|uniref:Uncharacterized protein n=1 Tax=uncultured Acidimicrobiales bacterium TaxID=310071 RepID=A0A6J4IU15_9ACTN|nr:MAG: hypothetical protein AVDCRST_MAG10-2781 [uncultured Acidimicrobiales bacterium]